MRDVLHMLTALAQARGARSAPLCWQFHRPGARRPLPGQGPTRALPQLLVLPGWAARSGPHLSRLVARDQAACERLQRVHAAGAQIVSLYTGTAPLGQAGLLDGVTAAVPWPFVPALMRHAPQLRLPAGEAWVCDGCIWSADSPVLATELLLRVLQACGLAELFEAAQAVVLHTPQRQALARSIAQDAQAARVGPGTLERARRWLQAHWREPFSLATLAEAAGTSQRSQLRHFRTAFGHTPLQQVHRLRVTHAQMLLETSYLPIETIAERCGWQDVAALRTVVKRHTGLTPALYRQRKRLRSQRNRWGQDL